MTKSNSKRLKDPLVGINRRTARGREIRDLYRSRMAAIEDQCDGEPDVTVQAAVRRAVELHLVSERMRARLLAGGDLDKDSLEELVRVENMVGRADKHVAELIARMPKPAPWWQRPSEEDHDGDAQE
jgi:hypothetical protein